MARKIEEISAEYQQQASLLGDLEYRISVLQQDASKMRRRMRELNKEAHKAANRDDKQNPVAVAVPTEAVEAVEADNVQS